MDLLLAKFALDNRGATAIEYGLIAAGIGIAILAALQGVAGTIGSTFNRVDNTLANAGK